MHRKLVLILRQVRIISISYFVHMLYCNKKKAKRIIFISYL